MFPIFEWLMVKLNLGDTHAETHFRGHCGILSQEEEEDVKMKILKTQINFTVNLKLHYGHTEHHNLQNVRRLD